ncbi:hypothetical protein H5410_050457 [Solanum commersonii]|uniref:Ulp1 protease family, C-terminal catalytic domain containing protein n=1 Tax=Solanum commersonii TaxID=4109 RepID=A0A9J5WXZ9_SOLCO|nr:hypothetical protein H5410_050457 [Solanum commersonii]
MSSCVVTLQTSSSTGEASEVKEDPNWAEQKSKSLHAPTLMANQTSIKRKSKKEMGASSKAKDAKTQKKRGRKVTPPISRPTLPMLCISFAFNLDLSVFDYLRSRYATLLWKYGTDKAKAGYVSKNDDPTRLKGVFIPLTDDELINVE